MVWYVGEDYRSSLSEGQEWVRIEFFSPFVSLIRTVFRFLLSTGCWNSLLTLPCSSFISNYFLLISWKIYGSPRLIIHSRLLTLQNDMWQQLTAHDHVKLIPGEGWSGCAFWREIGNRNPPQIRSQATPLRAVAVLFQFGLETALEAALKWQMGRPGMDSLCCFAVCPNASSFHVQVAASRQHVPLFTLSLLIKSSFPLESPSSCHWLISWGDGCTSFPFFSAQLCCFPPTTTLWFQQPASPPVWLISWSRPSFSPPPPDCRPPTPLPSIHPCNVAYIAAKCLIMMFV